MTFDQSTPLSHARATLALGLPLIGSSLAQMLLHVANTVIVGWYGAIPLAALVIAASTFFIVFVLGSGFAKAVVPLAAEAAARGDEAELRRAARMAHWLSIAYGLLVLPLFWYAEPILLALGQEAEVALLARDYLRVAGPGMIPALIVTVLQGWLAALGRTQVVLWVTVAAVVINTFITWVFVFGRFGLPELGVTGAGMASLVVQVFSALALGLHASRLPALRRYQLYRRFWRADGAALRQVFHLGLPIGLTGVAEGGMFQASAIMMGWLGPEALAAHGIALELSGLAYMIHTGFASAATIRVAGFASTGAVPAMRLAARVAIGLSAGVAAIVVVIFLTWPERIIGFYLDEEQAQSAVIIDYGARLLLIAAVFQLADSMQSMALGLLRALQDTRVPMLLAVLSYWVIGIPSSYVFAFVLGHGGEGLWSGLVVGLSCACLSLMTRFWRLAPKPGVAGEPAL